MGGSVVGVKRRTATNSGDGMVPEKRGPLEPDTIEKNRDRWIRGRSCLALGRCLKHQAEPVRLVNEVPEEARAWEAMFIENGSNREEFVRFSQTPDDRAGQ